jgi:hypothetical protein
MTKTRVKYRYTRILDPVHVLSARGTGRQRVGNERKMIDRRRGLLKISYTVPYSINTVETSVRKLYKRFVHSFLVGLQVQDMEEDSSEEEDEEEEEQQVTFCYNS